MSNLKQRHSLLEENIKLNNQKNDLHDKMNNLMSMMEKKMSEMVTALNDIKNKEVIVTTGSSKVSSQEEQSKIIKRDTPVFIPSSDTKELKSNISSEIQKKTRKTNLSDSLNKLAQIEKNVQN